MIVNPSKYMTGIPVIDKQHKEYIALVNKLVAKHKGGGMSKREFFHYVNDIVTYTLEHFDAEEFLMRSVKHPFYEEHLDKHNVFRDKMDEFLERIDTKAIDMEQDVDFLCKWLVDWFKMQVLDDDIKLAKFIKENNIACD